MSVLKRIRDFNQNRPAALLQEKMKRMAKSSSRFYRGTCHLFYEDLAAAQHSLPTDPTLVWICGDLHLENFGGYTAADGHLYYDLNDFDEASLAPASWEISRFMTSIVLTFNELSFESAVAHTACTHFVKSYQAGIVDGATHTPIYIGAPNLAAPIHQFLSELLRADSDTMLDKLTQKDGTEFKLHPKKRLPLDETLKTQLTQVITQHFGRIHQPVTVLDACAKVAGNSSLGVARYLCLVRFRENPDVAQVLDIKECVPSVIALVQPKQPNWANEAKRIVWTQKKMQYNPPPILTPCVMGEKSFLIKKVLPTSEKMDIATVFQNPDDALAVVEAMAKLTAMAHLRSCRSKGASTQNVLKKWGQNLDVNAFVKFAFDYAAQVQMDYQDFCKDLQTNT